MTDKALLRSFAAITFVSICEGCAMSSMQTARTTPPGEVSTHIAAGYVHNEMVEERGVAVTNFFPQIGLRYGVNARLDVGATTFMGLGCLLDAKLGLLPQQWPLAGALHVGFGGAYDITDPKATVLHVPIRALASYDLVPGGGIVPYGSLGFGLFWILGYSGNQTDNGNLVERQGHGDGIITISFGAEFSHKRCCTVLLEYTWWKPVFDDPGDRFAFIENHFLLAGTRF